MKNTRQKSLKFLDLFAGAGGLSEGFIRAGFTPIAHVESDKAACFTLKTRTAYHWLKKSGQLDRYKTDSSEWVYWIMMKRNHRRRVLRRFKK